MSTPLAFQIYCYVLNLEEADGGTLVKGVMEIDQEQTYVARHPVVEHGHM